MSEDERKSRYSFRGGTTEVVQLDNARRSKTQPPPRDSSPRSDFRAKPQPSPSATTTDVAPRATTPPMEANERTIPSPPPSRGTSPSLPPEARPRERQITPHSSAMPALASQAVDELMTHAPVDLESIMPRIERLFEHAEPLLFERFPGPFWADPRRAHEEPKRGSEISGIAASFVALGERSVSSVLRLLDSSRSDQRCAAAYVAGELPFAPVVEALGRVTMHADPSTRLAAVVALPRLRGAPGYESVLSRLRKSAAWGQSTDARVWAIQALEEVRDARSAPMFVRFLGEADHDVAHVASDALRTLTGRVLGPWRWKLWLRANAKRSRFHWLTDALVQWDAELRRVASIELVALTGHGRELSRDATRAEAKGLEAHYVQYWADELRHLEEAQS